jgi:hypothetical protein
MPDPAIRTENLGRDFKAAWLPSKQRVGCSIHPRRALLFLEKMAI